MKKFKHLSQLKAKQQELNNRKAERPELIHKYGENIKTKLGAETSSYSKTRLINEITTRAIKIFS